MARYERVARLYDLLQSAEAPLSVAAISEALKVAPATVKRLVRFLREELDVRVLVDRENGGYRLDGNHTAAVMGPSYDATELSALLSARELLTQIPPGLFRRETQGIAARLSKLLYQRPTGHAELKDRIRIVLPQRRVVDGERFETVLTALAHQKRLRIAYRSRSSDVDSDRVVSPQRLTLYKSNWYLAAFCHRTQDLRIFSVDRIASAMVSPIPVQAMSRKQLDQRLSSAYGIFEGEATATAHLRFTSDAARWIADEEWHPDQRLVRRRDGSVDLYVPYYRSTELVMDILRFGPAVEVMGPADLRRAVAQSHRDAAERYAPTPARERGADTPARQR